MISPQTVARSKRIVEKCVESLDLNLSSLTILTEAGSGVFALTPLIAAAAQAEHVIAVTRDSRYGTSKDVIAAASWWARQFNLDNAIEFSDSPAGEFADQADIVTNLGFVRPIDADLVSRLPLHSVIALMWEPWEFRSEDIDIKACHQRSIPVVGTNERDPRIRTFEYVGVLALKLVMECEIPVLGSRIGILGSSVFGDEVVKLLTSVGAECVRIETDYSGDLDSEYGRFVDTCDALILVEHCIERQLIGDDGGIRPWRLVRAGCALVHVCGDIDLESIKQHGVQKHPQKEVPFGHMTETTGYVGLDPVVRLHAGGLFAAERTVRARLAGYSVAEALKAAEATGIGLGLYSYA